MKRIQTVGQELFLLVRSALVGVLVCVVAFPVWGPTAKQLYPVWLEAQRAAAFTPELQFAATKASWSLIWTTMRAGEVAGNVAIFIAATCLVYFVRWALTERMARPAIR